ncbi:MAG: LysM peptidoglycan-binding domain-containing protein [Caldilineaceae bacterium SB0665_bin_21]|nr:LysM peptidoglycan-binding domain-containing protein [Caldilineaceae bacterium SB0665_bin_21]MYA03015.1 LysM peptidoglycan-binding domain-containing protein [Caldilineaceae bacterium SB0664_bin_22]
MHPRKPQQSSVRITSQLFHPSQRAKRGRNLPDLGVRPRPGWVRFVVQILVVACLWPATGQTVVSLAQTEVSGYTYYVQPGDTWFAIAQATGQTISVLQQVNPQAVRNFDLLYTGEQIQIPSAGQPRYHDVQPGDSLASVASTYDVSVGLLVATNPQLGGSAGSLAVGVRLLVPLLNAEADSGPSFEFDPSVAMASLPEGVVVPLSYRVKPDAPGLQSEDAVGGSLIPDPTLPPPVCTAPPGYADFIRSALDYWQGKAQGIARSAGLCNLTVGELVDGQDINGDGFNDLLVTLESGGLAEPDVPERTDLLLLHWLGENLQPALQTRASGRVSLLAAGDVNSDLRRDLVWTDQSCGASACYTRVHAMSWDQKTATWQDWTETPISMVNADVRLMDADVLGDGLAIRLQGGVHQAEGAGPQRARTEIWASRQGQPFALQALEFGPTTHLYHVVLEAHLKTVQSPYQDLHSAQQLYRQVLADDSLQVWHDATEQDFMRAFSLLRLAVIASYQQQPDVAAEIVNVLEQAYPASPFTGLGRNWLAAYTGADDPIVGCAAAQAWAKAHPATWQPFGLFGWSNPGMTPDAVCPVIEGEFGQRLDIEPAVDPQASTTPPAELALFPNAEELRNLSPEAFAASDDLPECPGTLDGYPRMIESLLNGLQGDLLLVETWLRLCEVVSDSIGTLSQLDLNSDGHDDTVAIVGREETDGQGPDGYGGRLAVYYGSFGNASNLIFEPAVVGLPSLLALQDLNNDTKSELAWVDEVCNAVCLSTVEVLTWNGDTVNNFIGKGAVITNGTTRLAPVPDTNPGDGYQIVLEGGVSGLLDTDVQVSHVELWESIGGLPFHRVWFEYDPLDPDSRCLGLNLVEADYLLAGGPYYGYGPAIQMYGDILDNPTLTTCSIVGTNPDQEKSLLRGLAWFRLVQAHGLAGDMRSSILALEDMKADVGTDAIHVRIADAWRSAYAEHADPVQACQAALPIIRQEPASWQVTDLFGLDHPAETETSLCFAPGED